jgi:hypothetical protein
VKSWTTPICGTFCCRHDALGKFQVPIHSMTHAEQAEMIPNQGHCKKSRWRWIVLLFHKYFCLSFFAMFYIKNRITIHILEAGTSCWKQACSIMCRLNINKCHSCQTAGNSNFRLFQICSLLFQRLLRPGFHLNAWY